MSTPSGSVAPVAAAERYELLDVVRGFALFGVLLGNIMWMAYFAKRGFVPRADTWVAGWDPTVEYLIALVVDDKFYTLFTILFGMGFSLQQARATRRGASVVPTYARRLAALLLIGVLHAVVLWHGEVLHRYALVGFVLLLFCRAGDRVVLGWAVAVFVLTLLAPLLAWAAEQVGAVGWQAEVARLSRRGQFDLLMGGGWPGIVEVNCNSRLSDYAAVNLGNDTYVRLGHVLWKFLLGVYLGRRLFGGGAPPDLGRLRRHVPWLLAAGLLVNGFVALPWRTLRAWDPGESLIAVQKWIPGEVGVLALSAVYALGIVLLYRAARGRAALSWLAPLGRMALTNYLTQSLCFVLLFYGVGLGLLGAVGQAVAVGFSVLIFVAQAAASAWWLRRFRFGPAEWAWRCATYGRIQPFRRAG